VEEERNTDLTEHLQPSALNIITNYVKGYRCVLYGPSWTGKTTLAILLIPRLGKALYIDSDVNFPVQQMAEKVKADIIYRQVRSFEEAFSYMRGIRTDAVVVDSLSGLMSQLIEREGAGSPRITLLSAQLQDQLVKLCKRFNTSIIVTHIGIDFKRGERIKMNQALLRYIDVIIKVDADANGRRTVTIQRRTLVENPDYILQIL
jgi:thymidine kinase